MEKNPVVHFEMPYDDRDRAAEFYNKAFGWTANKLGAEMGDYMIVMTNEYDEKTRMPKKPGMINGGMYKKSKDNNQTSVVISVPNIQDAVKKVEAAGGKIFAGPDNIPGVGIYVGFFDSEGNRVGMLEPSMEMAK